MCLGLGEAGAKCILYCTIAVKTGAEGAQGAPRSPGRGDRGAARGAARVWVLPWEKYFRARADGSSASFFLLSFSATLELLPPLRIDGLQAFGDGASEPGGSCGLACAAMSTLLKLRLGPSVAVQTKLK